MNTHPDLLADLAFGPPVIAHRGARADAPENTLAAFQEAAKQGAIWIETDVKLTQDGVPILMHDDTLDRTTNGKGAVADTTWHDMRDLDAGSWFNPSFATQHVPQLSESLQYFFNSRLRLNLELKPCPGRTQATVMVTLIEAAKIWPQDYPPPLLSSFDIDALVLASRLHPGWPRGLLLDAWQDDWADLAQKTSADSLHLNESLLTKERIEQLQQAGKPILCYTVNDPVRAKELLYWGVSAVFSDNPKTIIQAL